MAPFNSGEDFICIVDLFKRDVNAVLFLYLMYYPDYPYKIETTLREISRKNLKSLGSRGAVSRFLGDMEDKGIVTHEKDTSTRKSGKNIYSIDTSFLTNKVKLKTYRNEIYITPNEKSKVFIDKFISLLQKSVKDSERNNSKDVMLKKLFEGICSESSQSLKDFDLVTVLDYLSHMILGLEGYYYAKIYKKDLPQIKDTERDPFFSVIDFNKLIENKDILEINFSKNSFKKETETGILHKSFREAAEHLEKISNNVLRIERYNRQNTN